MEKANPFPSETVDEHWKNSETVRTLRFKLSLTESDDKKCPEFSFLDLVKTSTSNDTPEKTPWKEDGEEENLRALAKKFEEKYAPKSKKRRRDRVEDLIDVTYGYDDTDPFVDDTEAHDEFISADWTTEHGGFYINQGVLNFRPLSPAGESEDEDFKKPKKVKAKTPKKIPKVPKAKKVKDPSEKKERKKSTDKEKKPRKSSSGEKDKEKKHKKKLSMGTTNITNLLSSPSSTAKNTSTSGTISTNPALSPSVVSQGPNGALTSQSSPAKLLNSSQLSNHGVAKTEPGNSVMVNVNGNNSVEASESMSGTQPDKVTSAPSSTSLQNGIQSGEGNVEVAEPTLPQCLPADLESCILRLKQAGSDSGTEGKCKFFNSDVNHMLLELQTKSRTLSGKVQSGIYEFLAYYLPCTKETLKKRAKNLLINEQAARLREPMAKLKAAVDRVIPEQVKRFEEEVKRHVEEESQRQSSAKQDGENADDHKKELFKSAMELVEESEKSDEITTPTDPNAPAQPEDKTKKSVPKRKFIWTDELRQLLCDVVEMKIKIFEMSKTRAQSAEEHLKVFFENDVRPLWPKGWMTSRILFKESKQAHGKYTSVPTRVYKKAIGPKKQGDSPENQGNNAGNGDVKDMASATPSVVGSGSTSVTTAPVAVPVISASLATTATALSVLKNLAQSDRLADIKPTLAAMATVIPVQKPVTTTASVTKMETTSVSRPGPEQKPQTVSVISELNLGQKDTAQKSAMVKSPPLSDSLQSKPTVTILDFADMMMPQGQTEASKLLHSQQATPPKQPLASFLNKTTSSPKEKPRDQLLTHLPSSVITTTTISLPIQSSTISPARTQITMSSPPKIIRSSPIVVQSTGHSGLMAASVGNLTAKGLPNNFIDLATSSLMQQQQAAVSLASPSQTILDAITSPRRPVDLKSCQATHSGFVPGLSPQSIAMSLSSPMTSQALHQPQPQPPNLTLFGAAANLHGKATTPLTHIGIVPSNLQSAMLHLSRQQQEQQSGIVLPQNHFNPVLLGMSPTANQSLPSLQLPHGALLSNQPVFQDPNQTSSSVTHPSPFLPRFS